MVLKPDGSARKLSIGKHAPLGFITTEYQSETVTLDKDELLCLYTDGLTESIDESDTMLQIDGVQQMLQKVYKDSGNESTQTLQDKFTRLLDEYEGNAIRTDDRTFLLLKAR
ncbi:MAG: SpoIIE family protein phosphatase [Phycisphaeraceae bacterium]|nr:SpoIIE family protein phosphatase [Phycisphaeraceae bacterium]